MIKFSEGRHPYRKHLRHRKNCFLILLLVCSVLAIVSCHDIPGSGKITRREQPVSGFQRVSLEGEGVLTILQNGGKSLAIEAETNIMPRIQTDIHDGVLRIRFMRENWPDVIRPTMPIRYQLELEQLQALGLSGSGSIQAGAIRAHDLEMDMSGSGDITLQDVRAESIRLLASGSAKISLKGSVRDMEIAISGSGICHAEEVECESARVYLTGSGHVAIHVNKSLDVSISGSGSVSYTGQPAVRSSITGSGIITEKSAGR
jgi:hypothetical protein